jgi:hypothetical protein
LSQVRTYALIPIRFVWTDPDVGKGIVVSF